MTTNPYESPENPSQPLPRRGGTSWILHLLTGAAIVGVLVVLLLPASRTVPESARRMQCGNHLKQITIALHNYESAYGCLPPAYTVDAAGQPLHSWRTLLLPFMEHKALYETIDLTKPWDDPVNEAARNATPHMYRCPSSFAPEAHTTYLAVVADGGCLQPDVPRLLDDNTDDKNLTLMVVEVPDAEAVPWMSPHDFSDEFVLQFGQGTKQPHPRGAMAACVSGRVIYIPAKLRPAVLRALISVAGNDDDVAKAVD